MLIVRRFGVLEEAVEIGVGVAVNPEAHVEALEADFWQLLGEHFHIPRRLVRLVINNPQSPDLLIGQLVDRDARNFLHPEPFRRESAAVTDDDDAVLVDDDRLNEAELSDGFGDIGDLRFVVPLCVFGIRDQIIEFLFDNAHKK